MVMAMDTRQNRFDAALKRRFEVLHRPVLGLTLMLEQIVEHRVLSTQKASEVSQKHTERVQWHRPVF